MKDYKKEIGRLLAHSNFKVLEVGSEEVQTFCSTARSLLAEIGLFLEAQTGVDKSLDIPKCPICGMGMSVIPDNPYQWNCWNCMFKSRTEAREAAASAYCAIIPVKGDDIYVVSKEGQKTWFFINLRKAISFLSECLLEELREIPASESVHKKEPPKE